ncbi:MAG: M14 family zinc carboxypeptidase [Capnocytophaga sp.]|nr:M14 family zinc carboxypeptidase [Capnocytophaga sp.]
MNYCEFKEQRLHGRYITYDMIASLLNEKEWEETVLLGHSVKGTPISLYRIGTGNIKILAWSQMHGNESTTTKALFDVINFLSEEGKSLLECVQFCIIPMLNPDGAESYTRLNANAIDLNRDAYEQTQPESQCLRKAYDRVQPDYCLNLHDQRTIFSVGNPPKPATISFLAPSYNQERTVNMVRRKAMQVIVAMNAVLQQYIPQQVGRFDDSFNINCTGDYYTSLQIPTILFESGHFPDDYNREQTRELTALAMIAALSYICKHEINGVGHERYFEIPENTKMYYDCIIRDDVSTNANDIGLQWEEKLIDGKINFLPYIIEEGNLSQKKGHYELLLSEILPDNITHKEIKNYINIEEIKSRYVKI